MLNVGQGDSFVLQLASQEVIVVDSCRHRWENPTINVLEKIREERECADIDVLCVTHPHYDHFSGVHDVFDWCKNRDGKIKKLVICNALVTETARDAMKAEAKGIPLERCEPLYQFIELQKDIERFVKSDRKNVILGVGKQPVLKSAGLGHDRVELIGPSGGRAYENFSIGLRRVIKGFLKNKTVDDYEDGPELNDASCILLATCSKRNIVFTGDSSAEIVGEAWESFCDGSPSKIDVIKIPHHGSRGKANDVDLTREIWPTILKNGAIALLSFGGNNSYGHPHAEILQSMREIGVHCVSTNHCPNCPPIVSEPSGAGWKEEEIREGALKSVELTIDSTGNITPVSIDQNKKCKMCNSLALKESVI